MAKYRRYSYELLNPEKYKGSQPVIFKSSWERDFGEHCDKLPSVLSWGYEMVQIPYRDPISNSQKVYIPDFFVEVARSGGESKHYVFEIKPKHEQLDDHARNKKDAAMVARNNAKWTAAARWAERHSAELQILNESDLYGGYKLGARKHPVKTWAHTHGTTPQPKAGKIYARKPKTSTRAGVNKIGSAARRRKVGKVRRTSKIGRVKKI